MTLRSLLAVGAGIVVTVVVTTLVDILLHVAGIYPPIGEPLTNTLSALALSYRIVITIAAAWLTARLAPARPMKHAIVLGVIGTLLGVVGVIVTWNQGLGPRWYPIAVAALSIPQCWAGGWLHERQSRGQRSAA